MVGSRVPFAQMLLLVEPGPELVTHLVAVHVYDASSISLEFDRACSLDSTQIALFSLNGVPATSYSNEGGVWILSGPGWSPGIGVPFAIDNQLGNFLESIPEFEFYPLSPNEIITGVIS